MKKFIYELVTNRLGIILATFNLCVLAAMLSKHIVTGGNYFEIAIMVQNTPAFLLSYIAGYVPLYVFPQLYQYRSLQVFFIIPFIIFQWLFIAWSAKFIARKLKSNKY